MLSKNTKIIVNYIFGIGLFIWLSFSIYHQLKYKDNLHLSLQQLKGNLNDHRWTIYLVCFMMIVNWGIEAFKWKILIKPLERLSYRKSFYAVLSGVSFSVNTPNHIGEYGGRILYLKARNRWKAISVTFVGSVSQLITTLIFGIAGLSYFLINYETDIPWHILPLSFLKLVIVSLILIITGIIVTFYFHLSLIVRLFEKIKWLRRFRKYVVVIAGYPTHILVKVLGLSILRYLVFSAQYLILLRAMGVEVVWWQGFGMIYLLYLTMAMIPSITIAELGIRGEVGLYYLGLLSANKMGIIAATFGIWLINLVVPAILGSLLLLGIKVLNEDKIGMILKKQQV